MAPLLEIKDLKIEFTTEIGKLRAVDGVSYSVEKGQTLGVVGESGCGKSVTAMSILRLIPNPPGEIVGGEILWKGEDILKMPYQKMPQIRGKEIAMIFQDPMTSLNPVFTIERQLGEVLAMRFGMEGAEARRRMVETLEMVGIADPDRRVDNYPHELSGGMKQRIMIAMALMCEPDLLIADEPTTALDVTIQAQILYLMRELQEKTGTSIIMITHDMGVVAETCDEVVVMYAGKVAERATAERLFAHNRHPYTHGLLNSIPRKGLTKDKELFTIEGMVPSLFNPPKGCRFASRCFKKEEKCVDVEPMLEPKDPNRPNHLAACHFPVEETAE